MNIVAPGIWKIKFGEPEDYTPVKMVKHEDRLELLSQLPHSDEAPIETDRILYKSTKRGFVLELPLDDCEKIYGFGLQLKSFNQTGRKKHLRTNADPVADTGDTHAPVPFYVSTKGYGVLVDTARYVSFYCGSSRKLRTAKTSKDDANKTVANNVRDLYAVRDMDTAGVMTIEIPHASGVEIYLFAGPDMRTAVQRYNLFSGGGCLPPLWGLGNWYRSYTGADAEDVLALAEKIRAADLPCDVFGVEPGWQSQKYSCSYTWHKENFSAPEEFIGKMRDMHLNINLWEHVFVHPTSPIYDELKQYSGDYEVWNGLVPDLSIQDAKKTFAEYHRKALVEKGIAGFKLDECDSSDYTGGWSFPNCAEFPSGLDGELMHSLLGMFYQDTLLSIYREKNIRTYGQVRSSHALAASFPYVLYSDLYDHKDFIRGLVNSGFSGILWNPEVRQCSSVEDLVRRIQLSVLSPQSCINAWMIPNPPWLQYDYDKNLRGEVLENYTEVQDLCRKFLELRMSLIPYLYSSFARYRFEGLPPFRALVMEYPEDENTYGIDDQYMMGDSLMIAPVIAGQMGREVYLPEGDWYYFWSDKKFEGSKTYNINAALDEIPIFVKAGTLLPLAKPVQYETPDTSFEITVKCYGCNCRNFTLFEDDGTTFDYEKGMYNEVKLSFNTEGGFEAIRTGNYPGIKFKITGFEVVL
ncbi:TIM-barrel domain-containing protein [Pseudoclostridium thermosuccinogenes]|uniref:glycoside hydrolase family 31 protein n=1 Tax=Clostridium thermosuccinogenes TaxID=84032 RepID=UPI002FDB0E1C